MFRNSNNVLINGGTFTEHYQNHHAPSSKAIKRLLEASSLGALHNSGERFDPPKCHPNTRTAVLQELMDWFIGKFGWDNFVLWLYGPAGAGKSAIAQTFAELCAAKNRLIASFFFSRSDPRRNNAMALVATLTYQVSLNIPETREIIEAAIDKNPAIFQLDFQTQFQTLILDPLLHISSTGLFRSRKSFPGLIIIDGLDECRGADVQSTILNTISNALQQHRLALPFRILISSRPEYHLTTSFSIAPLHSLTFRLALDDTYQPDNDIRLYLTDSFCDIRKKHIMRAHLPDYWPSEEDIAKLVAKSSGQFIYAATVIRYVSSPRHNPLDRLKVIQGLLPVNDDRPYAQLDALYINILTEVEDIKSVLRILGMAFVLTLNTRYSSGQLGVNDLEKVMQLTPGTVQLLLIDLLSVMDASDNNEPIKFLHASFTDFLIDPTRSCQFFIDLSTRHEEAAHFCISAIESLDITTPLPNLAYQSLLSHLRLAGPLHDNTALREKIFRVPYVQHWTTYMLALRDDTLKYEDASIKDPTMFLEFLQTSEFRHTEELYLHHRCILDQRLRDSLASIPMSPCLAFWSVVSVSGILESNRLVELETFSALSRASGAEFLASVPGFLFSPLLDQIKVGNGRQHAWHREYRITSTPYLRMVKEFLSDPLRAGPYAVDQLTYTTAAVIAVKFAVQPWDGIKYVSPRPHTGCEEQWGFVWGTLTFMLLKAGYSAELVNFLSKQNLTFNIGKPRTDLRYRVQTLFGAVRNYLLKFNGSSPSPFKVIINESQHPSDSVGSCVTAKDLDYNCVSWPCFHVDESILSPTTDESILPTDEDTQETAGKKRLAMREYIVWAYANIRRVLWRQRERKMHKRRY